MKALLIFIMLFSFCMGASKSETKPDVPLYYEWFHSGLKLHSPHIIPHPQEQDFNFLNVELSTYLGKDYGGLVEVLYQKGIGAFALGYTDTKFTIATSNYIVYSNGILSFYGSSYIVCCKETRRVESIRHHKLVIQIPVAEEDKLDFEQKMKAVMERYRKGIFPEKNHGMRAGDRLVIHLYRITKEDGSIFWNYGVIDLESGKALNY